MALPKEKLIAVTLEYPPFNYTDKKLKMVTGASAELFRQIFSDMGYELAVRSLPWKRSQAMIKSGEAHIIFTYTRNKERQLNAHYSNPVSTISTIIIKLKSSKAPSSWKITADIRPYRIGVVAGYNYPGGFKEKIANNYFPHVDSITTKGATKQNLIKLFRGRIDYFLCPTDCIFEIGGLPKEKKALIHKLEKPIGEERTFHIGFSKSVPGWNGLEIRNSFNSIFNRYLKEGKVQRIYNKYAMNVNYEMLGEKLKVDWDSTLD